MITRIPAIEFMQRIVGTYQSADGSAQLLIIRCGYGQAVNFRFNNTLQIAGVVGAAGNAVELFAQLGLPNVVHLSGDLQSENAISFQAQEPPVGLLLARDRDTLTVTTSLKGAPSSHHVLQRA